MAQLFCKASPAMHFVEFTVTSRFLTHILLAKDPAVLLFLCRSSQEVSMFFKGLLLSFISFAAVVGVTSFISFIESRLSFLIRPFMPLIGILLLLFALALIASVICLEFSATAKLKRKN